MDKGYQRISCDFYDELEILALHHKTMDIAFWDENGIKIMIRDFIREIYSRDGSEYLETGKGIKIRLDRLIEVDGKRPFNRC